MKKNICSAINVALMLMISGLAMAESVDNKHYSIHLIDSPIGELFEQMDLQMGVYVESKVSKPEKVTIEFSNLPYPQAISTISKSLQKINITLICKSHQYYIATNLLMSPHDTPRNNASVNVICEYADDIYYQSVDQNIIAGAPSWDIVQYPTDYYEAYSKAENELMHLDPNAIWKMKEVSLVRVGASEKWYYKLSFDNVRMNRGEKRSMTIVIVRGSLLPAERKTLPRGMMDSL